MYLIALPTLCMLPAAMPHFVFSMKGQDRAPAAGVSTRDWFYTYKWETDDETFVPIVLDDMAEVTEPDVGDTLWFVMDEQVLGHVPVLRVVPNVMSDNVEIWYDSRAVVVAKGCNHIKTAHKTGRVGYHSQGFFDQLTAHIAKQGMPSGA